MDYSLPRESEHKYQVVDLKKPKRALNHEKQKDDLNDEQMHNIKRRSEPFSFKGNTESVGISTLDGKDGFIPKDSFNSSSSFLEAAARSVSDMAGAIFCSPTSAASRIITPTVNKKDSNENDDFVRCDDTKEDLPSLQSSWAMECSKYAPVCDGVSGYLFSPQCYDVVVRSTHQMFAPLLKRIEHDLTAVLGSASGPSKWERDWYWRTILEPFEEWLSRCGDTGATIGDLLVDEQSAVLSHEKSGKKRQRVVQNRIATLGARADKVKALREQLRCRPRRDRLHRLPVDSNGESRFNRTSGKENEDPQSLPPSKINSKDDMELIMNKGELIVKVRKPTRKPSGGGKGEMLWSKMVSDCSEPTLGTTAEQEQDLAMQNDEEEYYDSDPGEASGNSFHDQEAAVKMFSFENDVATPEWFERRVQAEQEQGPYRSTCGNRSALATTFLTYNEQKDARERKSVRLDCEQSFKNQNDTQVSLFVQEQLQRTFMLTWHPPPSPCNACPNVPSSSTCVKAWIEQGSTLSQMIVEPKFMWSEAYQPDLLRSRRLNTSSVHPYKIRLIGICRILPLEDSLGCSINRYDYPFAKTSCSFTVQTYEDDWYVFEAGDPGEMDFIVHSLKLLVARFMTLAVGGDTQALVQEFFVPPDGQVMGGDPCDSGFLFLD